MNITKINYKDVIDWEFCTKSGLCTYVSIRKGDQTLTLTGSEAAKFGFIDGITTLNKRIGILKDFNLNIESDEVNLTLFNSSKFKGALEKNKTRNDKDLGILNDIMIKVTNRYRESK